MSFRLALLVLALCYSAAGCCCNPYIYRGGCCGSGSCVKNSLTCHKGCGEMYWGDWISDPPDCCDPCDNCGNFTGGESCKRGALGCYRPCWPNLFRLHSSRCGEGCTGCASCGGGEFVEAGESYDSGEVIHQAAPRVLHDPTWEAPAPRPAAGVPGRTGRAPAQNRTTRTAKPRIIQPVVYEEVLDEADDAALAEPAEEAPAVPMVRRNYAR